VRAAVRWVIIIITIIIITIIITIIIDSQAWGLLLPLVPSLEAVPPTTEEYE